MIVYHTSPKEIKSIHQDGLLGSVLCFSNEIYMMSQSEFIYELELNENEIINANSFFYRNDCDKLDSIVKHVMKRCDVDEDTAQEYLSDRDHPSDPDQSWWIQGKIGECAKILGYIAAESQDEQGTVYLIDMLNKENKINLQK